MNLNMNQSLQQEQKLILTTELKMSLSLLQMPIEDLQDCIEKELEENPLLEVDYDSDDKYLTDQNEVLFDRNMDTDYTNLLLYSEYDNYSHTFQSMKEEEDQSNPVNYISRDKTLKEYLLEQVNDRNENKEVLKLCKYLIECIDEDGFITQDIIDHITGLMKSAGMVQKALDIIKNLQPCGIGASDYKECLLIQLRKKGLYEDNLKEIIMKHLNLLAGNKLKELSRIININMDTAVRYMDIIKSLEPKPARGFYTGEAIKYIVPEAVIRQIGDDFYIIMNDEILPKLNVNSYYRSIMKENNNPDVVKFIHDKVNSALAFIKGIDQRRNTIYRLLEKIIEYQKDYFIRGELYLKPMTLRDLSEALYLHESTVSRAIKGKYISTARGIVKLKELFTNGINAAGAEEDISTKKIKMNLMRIIKDEDKHKPLSDQAICDLLNKENINISRRTVAKYREELGVGSSGRRKLYE